MMPIFIVSVVIATLASSAMLVIALGPIVFYIAQIMWGSITGGRDSAD